ncbi:HNH endonuclease [Desulfatirhabdium butyrativorans]|uniref:HNH endonuclease n=1 Tax=Desulfatirhabdium butyrativorans TaxID=340467 RepID=UPI001B7F8269|nr:HNH endonuclease [Desulfatirhabdium butyrativorans]
MEAKTKINGKRLASKWGLDVAQARYSEWGNWYATLSLYPAALLDANGYVLIQDELTLQNHPKIKVTKQINVPDLISTLPDYVRVSGLIPEEITDHGRIPEGARTTVSVNRYERSSAARKACLDHYGYSCAVCGHAMAETYGPRAAGLIHVHHLVPLSELTEEYLLDPITDLRPVCPNCHAFLHLFSPPMSIDDAKRIIRTRQ